MYIMYCYVYIIYSGRVLAIYSTYFGFTSWQIIQRNEDFSDRRFKIWINFDGVITVLLYVGLKLIINSLIIPYLRLFSVYVAAHNHYYHANHMRDIYSPPDRHMTNMINNEM